MFNDRKDAGEKLALALSGYRDQDVLVLAIPRGGAETGYHVAKYLNADLSLIITRKLGYPSNPEAAFGAVAEDGSVFLLDDSDQILSATEINEAIKKEKEEIKRRIKKLRKDKPLPDMNGRTVIITDDGIATGATIFAAIALCKKKKAGKIIVAVPISGQRMELQLQSMVDDVIILEKPSVFYAVGQGYRSFNSLSDEETTSFIDSWQKERLVNH